MSKIKKFLEAIGQEPTQEQEIAFAAAVREVIESSSNEVGRAASQGHARNSALGGH